MSSAASKLRALYAGLEALYETRSGFDPMTVVHRLPHGPPDPPRETLLLREHDDALELALAFGEPTLERLETRTLDEAFSDEGLADALPIFEGLSHLAYVVDAARRECSISGLELETQAEVDKLALVVLHRWPVDPTAFEQLVERLYVRFELLPGPARLQQRYVSANRIALKFARALRDPVHSRRIADLRTVLRRFWHSGMDGKRALAS